MGKPRRATMKHWWYDDPPFSGVRIEWREGKEARVRDVLENDLVSVREAAELLKPPKLTVKGVERRRALGLPDLPVRRNVTTRSIESWIREGKLKRRKRGDETVIRRELVQFALDEGFLRKPRYHLSG